MASGMVIIANCVGASVTMCYYKPLKIGNKNSCKFLKNGKQSKKSYLPFTKNLVKIGWMIISKLSVKDEHVNKCL